MQDLTIKEKIVLITGAGRGLGLALVEAFLNQSWTVYALVRKHDDALKIEGLSPQQCIPILSDVVAEAVQVDIKKALGHSCAIDVLINNAGVGGRGKSIETTSAAEVESLLNVHCLGALRVTQAVMPYMRPNGKIINISSRFGSITKVASGELDNIKGSYAYRIAKAAQNMLTQCLSRELGQLGMKICALHPGKLKTDTAASDADRDPQEAADELIKMMDKLQNGKFYSLFGGELEW